MQTLGVMIHTTESNKSGPSDCSADELDVELVSVRCGPLLAVGPSLQVSLLETKQKPLPLFSHRRIWDF